eukprot:188236_1
MVIIQNAHATMLAIHLYLMPPVYASLTMLPYHASYPLSACRERKRKQKKHIIENPACACNTSLAMSSNAPGLFVMGSMRPEGQPREADGLINQNNVPKNTDNDPKTQMEMITIITPDGDKQELISNVNIADT